MENFLSSNEVFTVDLLSSKTPADVVFELSNVLDDSKAFGKKIYLKLSNIDLSQSQLLSLKSLISSINSTLCYIECQSAVTIAAAQSIGIETPNDAPFKENNEGAMNNELQINHYDSSFASNQQEENNFEEQFVNQYNEDNQLTDVEIEAKKYINLEMLNSSDERSSNQEFFNREEVSQEDNMFNESQCVSEENHENFEFNEEQNYAEKNESYSQEQVLEDFASRDEENNSNNFENNNQENINECNNLEFQEQNVLENIETSVNFEDFAQNNEVPYEDRENAIDDIFSTEKKLEHILEQKEERMTIDLCEPLDNSYTEEDAQIEKMNVKYVKQTVRSGNVISSDGNLVIIGDCHPGSEIHAAGDITVWGVLGGIAHAGNKGNKRAKVRALKLNPIQLRIANLYTRRPDALHTIYAEKTSSFTPEEARIINNEIVIYTMNEK